MFGIDPISVRCSAGIAPDKHEYAHKRRGYAQPIFFSQLDCGFGGKAGA
jgi:hypothetical protein